MAATVAARLLLPDVVRARFLAGDASLAGAVEDAPPQGAVQNSTRKSSSGIAQKATWQPSSSATTSLSASTRAVPSPSAHTSTVGFTPRDCSVGTAPARSVSTACVRLNARTCRFAASAGQLRPIVCGPPPVNSALHDPSVATSRTPVTSTCVVSGFGAGAGSGAAAGAGTGAGGGAGFGTGTGAGAGAGLKPGGRLYLGLASARSARMVSWSLLGSVSKPVMSPTSSIFRVSARPRTMVSNMHRGWNHSVMSPSYVCAGDTRPIRSSPFRMLRFAHVRFLHCPQMSPCGVCLCAEKCVWSANR